MSKEKLFIFDTTLRDGAQTQGVDFSVEDKVKIANILSDIGVDYIEGGWPGANPIDTEFFNNPPKLKNTIFTAFGMTKKNGRSADNDPSLSPLVNANCPAVCVVGKSWDFHVKVALGIKNNENLKNIIEFFIEVIKEMYNKNSDLEPNDQVIINKFKNRINFDYIPNEYVVWANYIWDINKSLFHHAVCTTDVTDKIEQINKVKSYFTD